MPFLILIIDYLYNYFNNNQPESKNEDLAVAIIQSHNSQDTNINGKIYFQKTQNNKVRVHGQIEGLSPGKHGFHIHETGDLSQGCSSLNGHFNPFKKTHSSRVVVDQYGNEVINMNRHVGDLGNIIADDNGVATIDFEDSLIKLDGPYSIIGRSVIVHGGEDDLGLGGDEESLKTGNAGKRVGCGIIGIL
jgi:Cu-Zn family superoxide dismutase